MKPFEPRVAKFQVQDLITAIARNDYYDALPLALTSTEWAPLGGYLQPFALDQDQMLIEQGAMDRTLYFVESGTLSVHRQDEQGRMSLALVGPGSVVGEGAFFSSLPRKASAVGSSPCKLWSLTVARFVELARRQPALALRVALALAEVLARRVESTPRRMAVV